MPMKSTGRSHWLTARLSRSHESALQVLEHQLRSSWLTHIINLLFQRHPLSIVYVAVVHAKKRREET